MKLVPTIMATFGLALLAGGLHVQTLQGRSKEAHSRVAFAQESHGRKSGTESSGGRKVAGGQEIGTKFVRGHEVGNGIMVAGNGSHGLTDTRESHG